MATIHSSNFQDITGQRFGRLLVLRQSERTASSRHIRWTCRCDCGSEAEIVGTDLRRGRVQSCGCLRADRTREVVATHGRSSTREYRIWLGMRRRCNNPRFPKYEYYGGRGIRVCDRWANSFEAFLADMGDAPPGTSIDRIDSNGNYEPTNCRLASSDTQARNRRGVRLISLRGETHSISEWAEVVGVHKGVISARIRSGWPLEEAVFAPLRGPKSRTSDL